MVGRAEGEEAAGRDFSVRQLRDRLERRHALVDVEKRRVNVSRLARRIWLIEAAAADLALVGIAEVPVERIHAEARPDHGLVVHAPGQADPGPEVVVVPIPEEAFGLNPAAHAPSRRAGQNAGNGTAGVIVVGHRQAADAEPARKLAVRRSFVAVADAEVQCQVGTDSPVVLEISAVVTVHRKQRRSPAGRSCSS